MGDVSRPDYVAGCKVQVGRVEQWYDPNCFLLEANGTLGNLGRNTVIGPKLVNVDAALLKDTSITEGLRMQFRAEVFNVANHANFALPAAGVFTASGRNPTAGQITQTVTTSRQIQFGLKLFSKGGFKLTMLKGAGRAAPSGRHCYLVPDESIGFRQRRVTVVEIRSIKWP